MGRGRAGVPVGLVAAALAVATTASTFLQWARSGQRSRTSYEIVDVADRAGVLPPDAADVADLWFLVPAVSGAIVLALAARRPALAGAMTTTLGALVGTGAILVARSPLIAGPAVTVAAVLGACTALSGLAVLGTARKETAA